MPTTGVNFDKLLDDKSGRNYSSFFPAVKKNRLVKEATIKYIDLLYATNDRQRIRDDLFSLTMTGVPFNLTANSISLTTGISDYDHLLDVLPSFLQSLNYTITGASNTTPVIITLSTANNNLRTGEKVNISGITGNVIANGDRYIRKRNKTTAALYSDAALTVPIIGSGAYISGGTIKRYVTVWAQDYSQKRSKLGEATVYYPKYEVANGLLKLHPQNVPCGTISLDYVRKPTTFIDVTNAVTDLELTYSYRMITNIADETVRLMGMESRDPMLQQNEQAEIIQQP